nr:MAG TPA_asm: hypothetical protein [Caudoviricetes sp.]
MIATSQESRYAFVGIRQSAVSFQKRRKQPKR